MSAASDRPPRAHGLAKKATAAAALILLVLLLVVALSGSGAAQCGARDGQDTTLQDQGDGNKAIPPTFAAVYRETSAKSGVPAAVLAAVGYVETHHGRLTATSSAGAQGPMQFLPSTWAALRCAGSIHEVQAAVACSARYLTMLAKEPGAQRAADPWVYAMCRYNGGCANGIKAEAGYGADGSVAGQYAREYGYTPGSSGGTLALAATSQCEASATAGDVGDVAAAVAPWIGKTWEQAIAAGMDPLGHPEGTPWCQIFVNNVLQRLGIDRPNPKGAYSGDPYAWATANRWGTLLHGPSRPAASTLRLQPGDIVMYGSAAWSAHVNLVLRVDGRGVTAVGGNQSCRHGNCVSERGPMQLQRSGGTLRWSAYDTRPIWAIVRPPAAGARA